MIRLKSHAFHPCIIYIIPHRARQLPDTTVHGDWHNTVCDVTGAIYITAYFVVLFKAAYVCNVSCVAVAKKADRTAYKVRYSCRTEPSKILRLE